MAYTYDEFYKKATESGVIDRFTEEDLQIAQKNPEYGYGLLGVYQSGATNPSAEQKLITDNLASMLRSSYRGTSKLNADGSLDYAYQHKLEEARDKVLNPDAFTYDAQQDPVYKSYEQTYNREGDRAMKNTLAEVAARTGGIPSSYAVSAAQQTRNNYAAALADAIPTLRSNAYSEYLKERAADQEILDYWLQDKQMTMEELTARKEAQATAKAQEYNRLMELASSGYVPTAAELTKAGMTKEMADALNAAYAASQQPTYKVMDAEAYDDFLARIEEAQSIEDMELIALRAKILGYDENALIGWDQFEQKYAALMDSDGGQINQPGASANDGNATAASGNMLTRSQWAAKRKKFENGQREGDGMYSWEGQFGTYDAYLKAWAEKYGRL